MPGLNDYLRELKTVKPGDDVSDVACAARMNAIQESIKCLVRGDNINSGPNILKKTQGGFVTLSGSPGGRRGGGGGATNFPFRVQMTSVDSFPAVNVYPGKVLNNVPYIYSTLMDEVAYDSHGNPIPAYLTPPYDDFSVWLIVRIVGGIYHPHVDIPREGHDPPDDDGVLPPDQSCYVTLDEQDNEEEFHITWDSPGSGLGSFPVRLAFVTMKGTDPNTGNPTFDEPIQYVFDNFRALVLAGDDIIPVG